MYLLIAIKTCRDSLRFCDVFTLLALNTVFFSLQTIVLCFENSKRVNYRGNVTVNYNEIFETVRFFKLNNSLLFEDGSRVEEDKEILTQQTNNLFSIGGRNYLTCFILETELSATRAQCLLSVSPGNVTTSIALIDHSFHRTDAFRRHNRDCA